MPNCLIDGQCDPKCESCSRSLCGRWIDGGSTIEAPYISVEARGPVTAVSLPLAEDSGRLNGSPDMQMALRTVSLRQSLISALTSTPVGQRVEVTCPGIDSQQNPIGPIEVT